MAKTQELSINKNKQETEAAELKRQEANACLTTEDELSNLVRMREQKEKAQARHNQLQELLLKQQFLEEEDKEISF